MLHPANGPSPRRQRSVERHSLSVHRAAHGALINTMKAERIVSGIKPSGELHLGNYFGATKRWVELQDRCTCLYFIADYHALTEQWDPAKLKSRTLHMALDLLACVADNISTGEIMPAGTKVLPFLSNIPEISRFVFAPVDESYVRRALIIKHQKQGSFVVGGSNYGQGSSRGHAALAPRYLGLKAVIAKSFARIHWQNLVNFGILPLTLDSSDDSKKIRQDDILSMTDLRAVIQKGRRASVRNLTRNEAYQVEHSMSERQVRIVSKAA